MFANLESGRYRLRVRRIGYFSVTREVDVSTAAVSAVALPMQAGPVIVCDQIIVPDTPARGKP